MADSTASDHITATAPAPEDLSGVEAIKERSVGLREPLKAELALPTDRFSEEALQLLKFHGSYQQDDRDTRRARKKAGAEPAYSMMIRSRIPGGVLSAEQYLVHDALAGRYGNDTLRITTRQSLQLHGILKGDLRRTLRGLNDALVTTLGACGDVSRNVLTCPAKLPGGARDDALDIARLLSDRTLPRTGAYHEIWLDGERVGPAPAPTTPEPDPLYGRRYLPRKFKIALAFEDDNCTDVLSNDLGFIAVAEGGRLAGFEVTVGGGLGMTHNKPETFPRLADPLAWIAPEDVLAVTEAVIAVQREHGDRGERRQARLKYLVHKRGVDWFRARVEEALGFALPAPRGLRIRAVHDHLGWHRQADGRWSVGIHVENGRLADTETLALRSGVRELVRRFRPDVHLTTQQNLVFTGLAEEDRPAFSHAAAELGVGPDRPLSTLRRWSMACPALPTCGLAVTESERVMPEVVSAFERELAELGLENERFSLRMTGCPNGCARPYTAEIGLVGRGLDKYKVFVGGSVLGDHVGFPVADLVPRDDLVATLRPVLVHFRDLHRADEGLGAFCRRVGEEVIASWIRNAA